MSNKFGCIMLVDDNPDDNFFHERVIRRCDAAERVVVKTSALEALAHLRNKAQKPDEHPDLILLDINMPGLSGWDFLDEYEKLDPDLRCRMVVVMLSTSTNPDDRLAAERRASVQAFLTKPLSKESLEDLRSRFA